MTYLWASATHRGRVRSSNQDRSYPASGGKGEGPALFAVADGMGGHVGGDVASTLAIDAAAAVTEEATPEQRIRFGNEAILKEVRRRPALRGMGTTMTIAELGRDGVARVAHVGDSRAYLLHEGRLNQLTVDHTVVARYVAEGRLRPEQVAIHPQRGMLTRALGLEDDLEIDTLEQPLQPGDRLLLCSDGLSSMLSDREIAELLKGDSPEEAAWRLVEGANFAGGHDNVTVVIVDVLAAPTPK